MATQFQGPYQSIYEAGLARQRENEARRRALATAGAARQGIITSGVSQIPQQEISREAMREEADLGARVAQAQEGERLQDKAFEQRKELLGLQASLAEAAAERERRILQKGQKSALTGQIIGGVLGGASGYAMKKLMED